MSAPARLANRVAVCFSCEAMYVLAPGQLLTEPLPCGHHPTLYLTEANLLAALRDAEFVEWAHRHETLDAPLDALHAAGGSWSPWVQGPARFRLPGGAQCAT